MCHCGFCGAGENLVEIEPDDLEIGPCLDFRLLLLHATQRQKKLDDQSPFISLPKENFQSHLEKFATSESAAAAANVTGSKRSGGVKLCDPSPVIQMMARFASMKNSGRRILDSQVSRDDLDISFLRIDSHTHTPHFAERIIIKKEPPVPKEKKSCNFGSM
jgi:hypothetical protein